MTTEDDSSYLGSSDGCSRWSRDINAAMESSYLREGIGTLSKQPTIIGLWQAHSKLSRLQFQPRS
jgi:hypothetical protein